VKTSVVFFPKFIFDVSCTKKAERGFLLKQRQFRQFYPSVCSILEKHQEK
jgi:hypothetical protein